MENVSPLFQKLFPIFSLEGFLEHYYLLIFFKNQNFG